MSMINDFSPVWNKAWNHLHSEDLVSRSVAEFRMRMDTVVKIAIDTPKYTNYGENLADALRKFEDEDRPMEARGSALGKGFEDLVRLASYFAGLKSRDSFHLTDRFEELGLLAPERSPKEKWGEKGSHWKEWFLDDPPSQESRGQDQALYSTAVAYFVRNKATHGGEHVSEASLLEALCQAYILVIDRSWHSVGKVLQGIVFPQDIELGGSLVQAVAVEFDSRLSNHITLGIETEVLDAIQSVAVKGGYLLLEGIEGAGKSNIAMATAATLRRQVTEAAESVGIGSGVEVASPWLPGSILHSMRAGRSSTQVIESLLWQAGQLSPDKHRIAALLDTPEIGSDDYERTSNSSTQDHSSKGAEEAGQPSDQSPRRSAPSEQLSTRFIELVRLVVDTHGKCLVIVDALDESTEGEDLLSIFPRDLPEGVCVLLTGRSGSSIVSAAKRRLQPQTMGLQSLGSKEIDEFIRRSKHHATIGSEGREKLRNERTTPQLLLAALDSSEPTELPESNRVMFENWFDSWLDPESPRLGKTGRELDLLNLLSLSSGGDFISLETIQSFLAAHNPTGDPLPKVYEIRQFFQAAAMKSQIHLGQRGDELRCRLSSDSFARWVLFSQQSIVDLEEFIRGVCKWSSVEKTGLPTLCLLVKTAVENQNPNEDRFWGCVTRELGERWAEIDPSSRQMAMNGLEASLRKGSLTGTHGSVFLERLAESCGFAGSIYGCAVKDGRLGLEKSPERAVRIWTTAISRSDNPRARRELAQAYARGRGIEPDFSKATEHYEHAIDLGDGLAKWQFARRLMDGVGVRRDRERGVRLLEEGVEGYESLFAREYAERLISGDGIFPDVERGLKSLEDLVDSGDHAAAADLGRLHAMRRGPFFDREHGRRLLEGAWRSGRLAAGLLLGQLHLVHRFRRSSDALGFQAIAAVYERDPEDFHLGRFLSIVAQQPGAIASMETHASGLRRHPGWAMWEAINSFCSEGSDHSRKRLWDLIEANLQLFDGDAGQSDNPLIPLAAVEQSGAGWLRRFAVELKSRDQTGELLSDLGGMLLEDTDEERRSIGEDLLHAAHERGLRIATRTLVRYRVRFGREQDWAVDRLREMVDREDRWGLLAASDLVRMQGHRSSEFPEHITLLRRALAQGEGAAGLHLAIDLLNQRESGGTANEEDIHACLMETLISGSPGAGVLAYTVTKPRDSRRLGFELTGPLGDTYTLGRRVAGIEFCGDVVSMLKASWELGDRHASGEWVAYLESKRPASREAREELLSVVAKQAQVADRDFFESLRRVRDMLGPEEVKSFQEHVRRQIFLGDAEYLLESLACDVFDLAWSLELLRSSSGENSLAEVLVSDTDIDLCLEQRYARVAFLASTRTRIHGDDKLADRLLLMARISASDMDVNGLFLDRRMDRLGILPAGGRPSGISDYHVGPHIEQSSAIFRANVGLCHAQGFLVDQNWFEARDQFKGMSAEDLEWWLDELRRIGDPESDLVYLLLQLANDKPIECREEVVKRVLDAGYDIPDNWR